MTWIEFQNNVDSLAPARSYLRLYDRDSVDLTGVVHATKESQNCYKEIFGSLKDGTRQTVCDDTEANKLLKIVRTRIDSPLSRYNNVTLLQDFQFLAAVVSPQTPSEPLKK